MTNPLFGQLRSIVNQVPSPTTWAELCRTLQTWSCIEARDEEIIPYVFESIFNWPSQLRVAPNWMLLEAINGNDKCLNLCKVLNIEKNLQRGELERLIKNGHLSSLEQIELRSAQSQNEVIGLMISDRLPCLEVLKMDAQLLLDKHLKVLESAPHTPPLRELSLAGNYLCQTAAASLTEWRGAARLESLVLDNQYWAPKTHGEQFVMPCLRRLSLHGCLGQRSLEWVLETPCLAQLNELHITIDTTRMAILYRLFAHPVATKLSVFQCDLV